MEELKALLKSRKLDMTESMNEATRLIEGPGLSPLQRRMLENYRRHSRAENSGNWERIFDDGMMADEPHYVLRFKNGALDIRGTPALKKFYANLGSPVIYQYEQRIDVSPNSFTSYSVSINYVTGEEVTRLGETVDNPRGYYARAKVALTYWPYDDQGRLIGEFGGEVGVPVNIEVPREFFITPEEAKEKLTPLIGDVPAPLR